jgi:NADPH-dependent 2,4-dienoyl-CoA reductase/sulfur reductase-like enzyme
MRGSLEERSGWKGCAQDRQCDILRIVPSRDLLVIEAGVGGAACANYAARAGLAVTVVDRGAVVSQAPLGGLTR